MWCVHLGDHGECECTVINSRPGLPGPPGDHGDAGMTGEFGQEGDVGDPGPHGEDGFSVRIIESYHLFSSIVHLKSLFLFPQTFLCCLAGTFRTQWSARPKRSKRGHECGHTERCRVAVISPHFRSAPQVGQKTDNDLCCVCTVCMCLLMCVCDRYRIFWRSRGYRASWWVGSTGCSRPKWFAWFPWEPRSFSESTSHLHNDSFILYILHFSVCVRVSSELTLSQCVVQYNDCAG